MQTNLQTPRKALNKAFLKVKPTRSDRELYGLTEEEIKIVRGDMEGIDLSVSEKWGFIVGMLVWKKNAVMSRTMTGLGLLI